MHFLFHKLLWLFLLSINGVSFNAPALGSYVLSDFLQPIIIMKRADYESNENLTFANVVATLDVASRFNSLNALGHLKQKYFFVNSDVAIVEHRYIGRKLCDCPGQSNNLFDIFKQGLTFLKTRIAKLLYILRDSGGYPVNTFLKKKFEPFITILSHSNT